MRLDKPSIITCFTATRRTGVGMSLLPSISTRRRNLPRELGPLIFIHDRGRDSSHDRSRTCIMIRHAADHPFLFCFRNDERFK